LIELEAEPDEKLASDEERRDGELEEHKEARKSRIWSGRAVG